MEATKAGDVDKVLDLMTDDALFFIAGADKPMDKQAFATAARMPWDRRPKFEGRSEIGEVQVLGDWAWMWTRLEVTATPPDGGPSMTRSGHTLSVLRREGGRWRLARDANMLAPANRAT